MQVQYNSLHDTAVANQPHVLDDAELKQMLSALADGELPSEDCQQLLQHLATQGVDAQADAPFAVWERYQIVGECLRTPGLHHVAADSSAFLARLRDRLADENPVRPASAKAEPRLQPAPALAPVGGNAGVEAANASVFRWKLVSGFASIAAIAAIGWNSMSGMSSGEEMQLASSEPTSVPVASQAPPAFTAGPITVAAQEGPTGTGPQNRVLIRDPKLDELLARQYGNTVALQPPAPFLRNASVTSTSQP